MVVETMLYCRFLQVFFQKINKNRKYYIILDTYTLSGLLLLGPANPANFASVGLNIQKLAVLQTHWHSGAPPGVTNSGPAFETQASIQGASCASWMMWFLGLKPAPRKEPLQETAARFFFGGAGLGYQDMYTT